MTNLPEILYALTFLIFFSEPVWYIAGLALALLATGPEASTLVYFPALWCVVELIIAARKTIGR